MNPDARCGSASLRSRLVHGLPKLGLTVAATLLLSACTFGPLDPQGPVASAERIILFDSLAIMLAIIVPTGIAALAFAWWFREGNTKARFRPEFVYSGSIEIVIWSIPTLCIIFLGGIIWLGSHELDPAHALESDKKPVNIQVVSLDWKWLFIYPDQGIATVNQLVVPANTPVHFDLTSASVMNAFFVPQLGSMIYTMNGMTTQLNLLADHPGEFYGRSTMFSGDGFPGMEFIVRATTDEAFTSWIQATQASGPSLDQPAYTDLAKQSMNVPPSTYRSIDPKLFQAIATQALPPGPGPDTGLPSPDVKPKHGG